MEDNKKNIFGTVTFYGELSAESVSDLIAKVEQKLAQYEVVYLFFTCNGGSIPDSLILRYFLDMHMNRITLIGAWQLLSSGFDVFLFYQGYKDILPGTHALIHLGSNHFDYIDSKDKKSYTFFQQKILDEENKRWLSKYKRILKKEEFERVKNGEDLFINDTRILEILKKIKKDNER